MIPFYSNPDTHALHWRLLSLIQEFERSTGKRVGRFHYSSSHSELDLDPSAPAHQSTITAVGTA